MDYVTDHIDYMQERIGRDLKPFVDPGTELQLDRAGRCISAEWTCRGSVHEAQFTVSPESVQVQFMGWSLPYKSFLVSPDMADLLGLAKMILQSQGDALYVPTKANKVDEPQSSPRPAVELLQAVLADDTSASTRIVMVTGDAGAGKTRVLQELVRRQAMAYCSGQTATLFLYVNAQGRALARLNEALATELQDLRATLTYHAVTPLVRVGALIPVIDGFDELIGVGGYDDAFGSLARFIEELDGQGQVLASARSTYYEEEFVARATVATSSLGGQYWSQVPVKVTAWGNDEFHAYTQARIEDAAASPDRAEDLEAEIQQVFTGSNADLKKKPLFVAKAVDLILAQVELVGADDLLGELIEAYLRREKTEKLLDRNEKPLLTTEQIAMLLSNLAEEMWNQGTRELDRRSVREVAEYVLAIEEVEDAAQQVVVERMPSLAFLKPGERPGSVAFEHELFFSAFLARALAPYFISSEADARLILSRSAFPPELADMTVRQLAEHGTLADDGSLEALLEQVASAGTSEVSRTAQVRENGGRIAASLFHWATETAVPLANLAVSHVVFPGGDLHGVDMHDCRFDNVTFRRTDFSSCRLRSCVAKGVLLQEVVVDPAVTRLELAGMDLRSAVVGLRTWEEGELKVVFEPDEMLSLLVQCGAAEATSAGFQKRQLPNHWMDLLERFVRAYGRANPLCKSDSNLKALFRDRDWREIESLLVEHGVVTREHRATKGPAKEFLRRHVLPEEIIAGARRDAVVSPEVRAFWDAAEARAAR